MGEKNNIKYIEEFWANIEVFSKSPEILSENFERYFLNDFLDNSKKWKIEIQTINDDLINYYKYHNTDIGSIDVNISFDSFIKSFLRIGKNYIKNNKRLLSKDMESIIQDCIGEHITSLDVNIGNKINYKPLSETITKLKIFY